MFTMVEDPDRVNNNAATNNAPIIHQRTYYCKLKKNPNGGRTPLPYLTPSGPDMDFYVRRTEFATPEIFNLAMKQPTVNKPKKVKNQKTNVFGETIGRLHLERQDIDNMGGKKSKALRKVDKEEKEREKAELESELGREMDGISAEFKQAYGFAKEM